MTIRRGSGTCVMNSTKDGATSTDGPTFTATETPAANTERVSKALLTANISSSVPRPTWCASLNQCSGLVMGEDEKRARASTIGAAPDVRWMTGWYTIDKMLGSSSADCTRR